MTLLGVWLKQIVTIVFLAILADFLLPGKSMQRYVRMVMGLAILAMMLQPIVPIFRRDFASKLADAATNEIFGQANTTSAESSFPAFQVQLQHQEHSQEILLLQGRLKQSIATDCGCTVSDVQIGSLRDGTVSSVTVVTPQSNDKVIVRHIVQYVEDELQITAAQVHVVAQ